MSASTPYLGSKLSMISKAENRYEGILCAIDTVNSTIALTKVRCFGTENRPTDRPIPPSDEIFENIVFRGSNIKDLVVLCEPPKPRCSLLQDPAIVDFMGLAPSSTASFHSGGSCGLFNRVPVPQFNHPEFPPQFGVVGGTGRSAATQYQGRAIGHDLTSNSQSPVHSSPSLDALRETPSLRQATPSAPSSNPTAQVPRMGHNIPHYGHKAPTATGHGVQKAQDGTELRRATVPKPMSEQARGGEGRDTSKRSTAAVGALANHRERGGSHRVQGRLNVRCDGPMKFDKDFDFESANARFSKGEKDGESPSKPEKVVNVEDKSVSSVPTQNRDGDKDQDPPGPNCYYNKSKSFFDQISSYDDTRKANDKSGKRRQAWAEVRRLNSETFSLPSRQNRGHGGCSDRSHSNSRGSVGAPHGGAGYRGGYRSSHGDRGFADLPEYRKDNKASA